MCRNCGVVTVCFVFFWTGLPTALSSSQAHQSDLASSAEKVALKEFLQLYVKAHGLDDDKTAGYSSAFLDLDGDGRLEAIVYLVGRWWCGTGGCPTMILARDGMSYKLVTEILITRTPIRVFDTRSKGWRNIGVWVQGGGILPGHEVELRFNGRTYPTNPTIPPAIRTGGKVPGEVVISAKKEMTPLYP